MPSCVVRRSAPRRGRQPRVESLDQAQVVKSLLRWRHRPGHLQRRGFTLVEAVVATFSTVVLLGAIASIVTIATRALPDPQAPLEQRLESMNMLDRLEAELRHATTISRASGGTLAFTTPDRTGDALPDTFQYSWDTQLGDVLVREVNTREADALSGVESFNVAIVATETVRQQEQLVFAFDSGASPTTRPLTTLNGYGISFTPALDGASTWNLTRVRVQIGRQAAADGTMHVNFSNVLLGMPTTQIATASVPESQLSATSSWVSVPIIASGLSASTSYLVSVVGSGSSAPGAVTVSRVSGVSGNFAAVSRSGIIWSPLISEAMCVEVYGTPGSSTPATLARRARITLKRAGQAPISVDVELPNKPAMP
ncbi:MAG: hypothetical protein SFZ23_03005 [Planctomycetota bacterium]|nr:hypothetical protein [Planctomycetota bacterium]